MIHPLARPHLISAGTKRYPITLGNEASMSYLNLNINSQNPGPYQFYPRNHQQLAKKYLEVLGLLSGAMEIKNQLNEKNIIFTQGSTESIDLIIRSFCEPNRDAIIITSPTFSYYAYRAMIENVNVINVPLQGENLNILNIEKILSTNAKVLFLCSPSNPVGTALDLRQIEEVVQKFKGIVVLDEAYLEWTDIPSCAQWVKNHENLIILRTFSKIWGLAGVRCGATLSHENIIDTLGFVQPMFCFPDSSADVILSKISDVHRLSEYRSEMNKLRRGFIEFLSNLNKVEKVYPSLANFVFVKFSDEKKVEQQLLEAKILVCNTCHQAPGTLRISIGTSEEMERTKTAIKE